MKILFRADASSSIGLGHVMRDLVLAKQYPNDELMFATRRLKGNLNSKIKEAGYKIKRLDSNRVNELVVMVKKLKIDRVVIDSYEIDYTFEKELKERTGVEIMVLDDTYEKHHCDILLNHNIYADKSRYNGLVPIECELRCGEEFTLLREEFYLAKEHKKELSSSSMNIFLSMGGADTVGLNLPILKALNQFPDIHTHLVTTTSNRGLKVLEEYVNNRNNVTLYVDSNRIAEIMSGSQMAIITPSVTLHEANFMELLFIPIQTADNQSEMVAFLEANGYPVLKEFDSEVLYHTVKSFLIFHQQ